MSAYIINAAPMTIQHGTQDLSKVQLPRVPVDVPQHCPKFFIWAQKGPVTPQLVSGVELTNMYGTTSFDPTGPYFNHSTLFVNGVNAKGNACMIERLIPADAGPKANLQFFLDVLPTTVNDYERNSDGSIKTDASGNPVIAGTVSGFKAKWVVAWADTVAKQELFGELAISAGNQVDSATGTQSQRYPIFELEVSSEGKYGNNRGIRLWAPTTANNGSLPDALMAKERAYPFYLSVIARASESDSPEIVETVSAEQFTMFTLKPGSVNPATTGQVYMGDILLNAYQNLEDVTYPLVYGDFGKLAIYEENIATLLQEFYAAEIPYIDSFSDFNNGGADKFLFNFVSGVSSQNVPYHTFQLVDDSDSVLLSQYSNVYAKGGSDGTLSDANHATETSARMAKYADPNDSIQEVAVNVESIVYDTGFPLATKYDLCNFISVRKDTFVVLSTFDAVSQKVMTESEENALAIALRTRAQLFPESDYFGTPAMRAMIVGRSGKVLNSVYKKRAPLTYEIAVKSADYMGAGNGRWKNGKNFDGAPGSILDTMYDVSITWVPGTVRNKNWSAGLNWVQAYDMRSFFFPALKTVYDDDTSVLNSYFTAMAICQLNKVANAAWREFSGVEGLSNSVLVQKVNAFVTNRVGGIFDNRYIVQPDAVITDMDLKRGYSWTLPIKIYANNMKSVMTTYVQAYRMSDYSSSNN